MVKEFLKKGIRLDESKVEAIEKLPRPQDVKGLKSFLGHASFYRRFVNEFAKIVAPLTDLQEKDVPFPFDNNCVMAFQQLKKALTTTPIIQPPNWEKPFEIMCDASDFAIGAVLEQRDDEKKLIVIHYASRLLTNEQRNFGITEK